MTVADATVAYQAAKTALERAAADLRLALNVEVAALTGELPEDLRAVARAVAEEFQIEMVDLLGRSKRREHVEPRFAVIALSHQRHPHYTQEELAAHFRRDHGMVAYALKSVRRLADTDPTYRDRVARIRAALSAGRSVAPSSVAPSL